MFWGGERLKAELPALISDFHMSRVDRASYRLRIGSEVYVSPTGEPDDPRNKPRTKLDEGQGFTIPAGQFGFILTEERVSIPKAAIGFISIRAGYKFRGLVNVSGFHVDPAYEGRLIFAVFNAGPGPVHLSRGEPCFLIWYADLDRPSELETRHGYDTIPSELTGPIAGGLQSFAGLLSKISENDKKLTDRVGVVEREQAVMKWAIALAVGALITLDSAIVRSSGRPISPPPARRHRLPPPIASLDATVAPSGFMSVALSATVAHDYNSASGLPTGGPARASFPCALQTSSGPMESTPVFDTYWRFAAERQAIYFRRLAGQPGPWTADPILLAFRFTNAYRAADRVSQFLIREVQYRNDRPSTPDEIFFRTLLFKVFNRIETWTTLEHALGPLSSRRTDLNAVVKVLDDTMMRGERLYSAAYIMPAPAFGYQRKHANHLALIKSMMDDRLPDRLRQAPDLKSVYEMLRRYPGIGPFLAFQYAIDLNYSELLDHDEASFVVAGPGALDGIAKCFTSTGTLSAEDVIHRVCDGQERSFAGAGLSFQTLFGRRLQPIDCQNLFCEISKYARVAHPEAAGLSGRTRIKQVYRRHADQLPRPFLPPRWTVDVDLTMGGCDRVPLRQERIGLFA